MENLFKKLQINNFFCGGAFEIIVNIEDIDKKDLIIEKLDSFCTAKSFYPLGNQWNEICYDSFYNLLHDALQFSLGFTAHKILDYEDSHRHYEELTKNINFENVKFFTNGFENPWRSNSYSSNSISDNTLDLAIVLVNENRFLFIYFLFDD